MIMFGVCGGVLSGWGWGGAGADHQAGAYQHALGGADSLLEGTDQQVDAVPSDVLEMLVHGGERRPEAARFRHVVEADDADLLRNGPSPFMQGPQNSQRHLVI